MTLEEFKSNITVLDEDTASEFRDIYINTFIDINSPHYIEYIIKLRNFPNGDFYMGFLWDCLKSPKIIKFNYIKNMFFTNDVYVFWDIHFYIEDNWKFKKNDMLKLSYELLLDNLQYLPEDIYIFDETLDWTLILTHETNLKGWPYHLKSGNI